MPSLVVQLKTGTHFSYPRERMDTRPGSLRQSSSAIHRPRLVRDRSDRRIFASVNSRTHRPESLKRASVAELILRIG